MRQAVRFCIGLSAVATISAFAPAAASSAEQGHLGLAFAVPVSYSAGVARPELSCQGAESLRCAGYIKLTAEYFNRGRTETLVVGVGRYELSGGSTESLRLYVSDHHLLSHLLGRSGRWRARAVATATSGDGLTKNVELRRQPAPPNK